MQNPAAILKESGCHFYYCSFSALDRYFGIREPGNLYLLTDASLVELVKAFEALRFSASPLEDASLSYGEVEVIFRCYDELESPPPVLFTVQELLYDPDGGCFLDPKGIYPHLRLKELQLKPGPDDPLIRLSEAAKIVSRYHYELPPSAVPSPLPPSEPSREFQRRLLAGILLGRHPEKGLSLLYASGFVEAFLPELHTMSSIPQSKEHHPEGNAWVHTLETFKYRKASDLTLSLALLLHDVGKPSATGTAEKPFDGHAELGAEIAYRFLRRLDFSQEIVQGVTYLVRYHMMPAALKRMPVYRTERIMSSALFPLLLELYRADLCASYRSPAGYYDACRIYRSFLKHRSNPYRRSDGRKQTRRGFEERALAFYRQE